MPAVRYFVLALLVCAPSLAFAQLDSVHVAVEGVEYPSHVFSLVTFADTLGPLSIVVAEPASACEPLMNPDEEINGSIVLVDVGVCLFEEKAQNAQDAGAVAVVLVNNDTLNPDSIELGICSICPPLELALPTAFVSLNSGQAIRDELATGPTDATIIPIRITPLPPEPTVYTHDTGVVQFDVFDYGFFGAFADYFGNGFNFNGINGLFVSTALVGIDGTVVGNPFEYAVDWESEAPVEPPSPPPPCSFRRGRCDYVFL